MWSSHKSKNSYENLSSIIYNSSFILKLWYLCCTETTYKITISGDNNFFRNTCFKESNNMTVKKLHRKTINFYEKKVFQLSHDIKNIH